MGEIKKGILMKFFYQILLMGILLLLIAAKVGYSANFYLIIYFMLLLASALAIALKYKNRIEKPIKNIYLKKEIYLETFILILLGFFSYHYAWLFPTTFLFAIEWFLSIYVYHKQK